jgi:hypothetical protein
MNMNMGQKFGLQAKNINWLQLIMHVQTDSIKCAMHVPGPCWIMLASVS